VPDVMSELVQDDALAQSPRLTVWWDGDRDGARRLPVGRPRATPQPQPRRWDRTERRADAGKRKHPGQVGRDRVEVAEAALCRQQHRTARDRCPRCTPAGCVQARRPGVLGAVDPGALAVGVGTAGTLGEPSDARPATTRDCGRRDVAVGGPPPPVEDLAR